LDFKKLLNRDPNQRIGVNDKSEIKNDEFFSGLDWKKIENKEYEPPFLEDDFEDELSPFERVWKVWHSSFKEVF